MPANLSPEYRAAEERFRQARTVEDKIACLEEMLRVIPKHKGSEKLQADLKTRLAKFRRQPKKKAGAHAAQHVVRREGAGQIALVGPPNSGKSSLLRALTHARPEVADYPYTTREEIPGMMAFEDVAFQLVDLPPLSGERSEPWVYDIIRAADLLWIVVEAANSLDEIQAVRSLLGGRRIDLYPPRTEPPEGPSPRPGVIVVTRIDEPGGMEDVEILRGLLEEPWPLYPVSAVKGSGLDALQRGTFEALDLVRIYTKQPGKPADMASPFALRRGSTVGDLARAIHKEVSEGLKFARIWGGGAFEGQTVQRDHVLVDRDVVEIHM